MLTKSGGKPNMRDVNSYATPQGPTSIDNPQSPGLHGTVYPCGSQGPDPTRGTESGRPGIGGDKKPHGSQQ